MHPLDLVFWSCLALGSAYTLVTVVLGSVSHIAGHAGHAGDLMHGHGEAAGGIVHGHGHAAVAAHPAHGHGEAVSTENQSAEGAIGAAASPPAQSVFPGTALARAAAYLSPMSAAGFLIGFGGGGVSARALGSGPAPSLLYACAGGMGLYWVAWTVITRFFGAAQASSHFCQEDAVGLRATVIAPIEGGRPGMIGCVIAGTRQRVRAVSDEQEVIPVGSIVRIRRIEHETAHVTRVRD
ncbi:MAG: NfeD family protein [Chthonomonadales bacterium]